MGAAARFNSANASFSVVPYTQAATVCISLQFSTSTIN